jgi:hypothetical protein
MTGSKGIKVYKTIYQWIIVRGISVERCNREISLEIGSTLLYDFYHPRYPTVTKLSKTHQG